MTGGIYAEEKCSLCGSPMRDNGRAVCCPVHKNQISKRLRVRIRHNGILTQRKFTSYEQASRFLNGIRFKIDEGTFDHRDYKADNPLGFSNLINQWLDLKKGQLKPQSWKNLNYYLQRAAEIWGNRNIKEIGYAEIEDFLFQTLAELSGKSRANAKSVLHSFWDWLRHRRILPASLLPEWPEVPFELGFRKIIPKEVQNQILEKVLSISGSINIRIWIALKWLATYPSIRPSELLRIREGHIDFSSGFIILPDPKEKKPKLVPMIKEDIKLIKSLPRAFPDMYFFRHLKGHGGPGRTQAGDPFHHNYIYRWWKRACRECGIKGVDLYGGTKHSTATGLSAMFSPEQVKRAMMISTNKAFERYFQINPEQIRAVYSAGRGDTKGTPKTVPFASPTHRKH